MPSVGLNFSIVRYIVIDQEPTALVTLEPQDLVQDFLPADAAVSIEHIRETAGALTPAPHATVRALPASFASLPKASSSV